MTLDPDGGIHVQPPAISPPSFPPSLSSPSSFSPGSSPNCPCKGSLSVPSSPTSRTPSSSPALLSGVGGSTYSPIRSCITSSPPRSSPGEGCCCSRSLSWEGSTACSSFPSSNLSRSLYSSPHPLDHQQHHHHLLRSESVTPSPTTLCCRLHPDPQCPLLFPCSLPGSGSVPFPDHFLHHHHHHQTLPSTDGDDVHLDSCWTWRRRRKRRKPGGFHPNSSLFPVFPTPTSSSSSCHPLGPLERRKRMPWGRRTHWILSVFLIQSLLFLSLLGCSMTISSTSPNLPSSTTPSPRLSLMLPSSSSSFSSTSSLLPPLSPTTTIPSSKRPLPPIFAPLNSPSVSSPITSSSYSHSVHSVPFNSAAAQPHDREKTPSTPSPSLSHSPSSSLLPSPSLTSNSSSNSSLPQLPSTSGFPTVHPLGASSTRSCSPKGSAHHPSILEDSSEDEVASLGRKMDGLTCDLRAARTQIVPRCKELPYPQDGWFPPPNAPLDQVRSTHWSYYGLGPWSKITTVHRKHQNQSPPSSSSSSSVSPLPSPHQKLHQLSTHHDEGSSSNIVSTHQPFTNTTTTSPSFSSLLTSSATAQVATRMSSSSMSRSTSSSITTSIIGSLPPTFSRLVQPGGVSPFTTAITYTSPTTSAASSTLFMSSTSPRPLPSPSELFIALIVTRDSDASFDSLSSPPRVPHGSTWPFRDDLLLGGDLDPASPSLLKHWFPNQCLVMSDPNRVLSVCDLPPRLRRRLLSDLHPFFCTGYSLQLLTDPIVSCGDRTQCRSSLIRGMKKVRDRDRLAQKLWCEFDSLLARYNCQSGYSVKWSCQTCSETYRDWICATVLPVQGDDGHPMQPCRSFCEKVEQRCPYLHPASKEQYAGEPAFICTDPQIPFIQSSTMADGHVESEVLLPPPEDIDYEDLTSNSFYTSSFATSSPTSRKFECYDPCDLELLSNQGMDHTNCSFQRFRHLHPEEDKEGGNINDPALSPSSEMDISLDQMDLETNSTLNASTSNPNSSTALHQLPLDPSTPQSAPPVIASSDDDHSDGPISRPNSFAHSSSTSPTEPVASSSSSALLLKSLSRRQTLFSSPFYLPSSSSSSSSSLPFSSSKRLRLFPSPSSSSSTSFRDPDSYGMSDVIDVDSRLPPGRNPLQSADEDPDAEDALVRVRGRRREEGRGGFENRLTSPHLIRSSSISSFQMPDSDDEDDLDNNSFTTETIVRLRMHEDQGAKARTTS